MSLSTHLMLNDPHVQWHRPASPAGRSGRLEDHEPEVLCRGYAVVNGGLREGQDLADAVGALISGQTDASRAFGSLERLIPTLNGHWALVVRWSDGSLLAAVDRARSIPLYYAAERDRFTVAHSALDLRRRVSHPRATAFRVDCRSDQTRAGNHSRNQAASETG